MNDDILFLFSLSDDQPEEIEPPIVENYVYEPQGPVSRKSR